MQAWFLGLGWPAADWTVETKVTFLPTVNYQGVGILLSDNATATATAGDLLRLGERSYAGGNGDVVQMMGSVVPMTTPDTYLRVTKQGTGLTGWWSVDGTNWTLAGSSTLTQDWPYIGLYAIRQRWNSGADTSANFDYFLIPEPTTMALLSVGALALLRRRRRK